MPSSVILGTARTPFGTMGGSLASLDATDLGGHVIEAALAGAVDAAMLRMRERINQRILRATEGRGVDRIVEVALGANLPLDGEVLAPSGVIASFASDAVPEPTLPFRTFLLRNATIRFVLVYLVSPQAHAKAVGDLTVHLQSGRLRHSIARRFPLGEIAASHEAMEAGHLNGKVIVLP